LDASPFWVVGPVSRSRATAAGSVPMETMLSKRGGRPFVN
jgi:hypothetical protein